MSYVQPFIWAAATTGIWDANQKEGLQIKLRWMNLTVQIDRELAVSKIILAAKF